jgi:nucleotide-binding universal stress UspA family protein
MLIGTSNQIHHQTNTMKQILIALDYEPSAQKIAETGVALAKAMNAKVTLIHVVANPAYYSSLDYSPIMGFSGFGITDLANAYVELQKAAQDFLDKSKEHLGDDSIKTIIKEGESSEAILAAAKEIHADIIVIGSHSRRGLDKILMGGITEKVLHHTSIPLFIVPTKK